MFKQNKQQPGAGEPQPGAAEMVNIEDDGLVLDDQPPDPFEQQLEQLAKQDMWPIDEHEPGFAPDFDVHEEEDEPNEPPIDINPAIPFFIDLGIPHPVKEEPKADPVFVKQFLNDLPEKHQAQFLEQLRDVFPEMQLLDKQNPMEEDINAIFERKRQGLELDELLKFEEQEMADRAEIQEKMAKMIPRDEQKVIVDLLKRGIRKHTEDEELKHLKYLMGDKRGTPLPVERTETILPSTGKAHLEDLKPEILNRLFSKFTFQGLLVISKLTTKWNQMFNSVFDSQTIVWFCNEEQTSRRFLPIEDCCEECHHVIDSEPVIRIFEKKIIPIIENVLSLTKNLKCLRLYRFSVDRLIIVKKLSDSCPQLQHLDLSECSQLTLVVIKELCICFPNLKHLILTATNLKEDMSAHICTNLTHLVTLVVSSTLITGQSLQKLSNSLKRLDIRCCPQIKISEFIKFLKFSGYIRLQHLKIDAINDKDIYRLIWTFFRQSLILFEVRGTPRDPLSAQSYVTDIPLMSVLQSLKFGKNFIFETRVLDNFFNSCPNMRSFSMHFDAHDVYRLSEANLIQMSHKWIRLERLELIGCRFLGQDFIDSLQTLKHLNYLNLTECSKLKDHFMSQLIPKLSNLNYLVLDKCLNLGKKTLESTILMANRMKPKLFRVSMIKCNLQGLPTLKPKYLSPNLRITYSSQFGRRYTTFDGQRIKIGNICHISEFLNGI